MSFKQTRSLYAFTNNNNIPKAKALYIKHCKILRKVIKVATKQHCSTLIAKYNNKIKTTQNIIKKEAGKLHSVQQVPTMNDEKLEDPPHVANASIISLQLLKY